LKWANANGAWGKLHPMDRLEAASWPIEPRYNWNKIDQAVNILAVRTTLQVNRASLPHDGSQVKECVRTSSGTAQLPSPTHPAD
jgi:hypothetical protein